MVMLVVAILEQISSLISRLSVIEGLIMRKWRGRSENVNRSGHIFMDQARQLEISGSWENDREGLPRYHRGGGDACRTVERGRVGREPGTPVSKKWARLVGYQKGQSMDIVRVKVPCDAVTCVNPDFIGKKRQSLVSFIVSLASDGSVPLGGLHHLRNKQG